MKNRRKPSRWPPSVELCLDYAGRALASLGLLVAVIYLLVNRYSDGPAEPVHWVYVGVGVSAFVQGLVLWGLSDAIVELRKIRAAMQNERNQDTD